MARKATMIDETLDFDPTVQTEADEARQEIAEAQRAARRSKAGKDKNLPAAPDRPTAAILPIYLREMGATPLIDETKEVELARELQEAREALAKMALRLRPPRGSTCSKGTSKGPSAAASGRSTTCSPSTGSSPATPASSTTRSSRRRSRPRASTSATSITRATR
jgi:hypothetical protein